MRYLIFFLSALVFGISCTKVITLDLNNNVNTLVIEGNVTNQAGPYFVKLSQSVNFYAANNYPNVANATVSISDDAGQNETLANAGNGLYKTLILRGVEGRTYSLKVILDGKTYTAQSTMPTKVPLDTIRTVSMALGNKVRYSMLPIYRDPIFFGNNYRFLVYVNGVKDKTDIVFNDNINNGQINIRPLRTSDLESKLGDTVSVEMQCTDVRTYDYYFSLSKITDTGPGGGTTPANPVNNIVGDALGLFSAHTVQTKSIVIQ